MVWVFEWADRWSVIRAAVSSPGIGASLDFVE